MKRTPIDREEVLRCYQRASGPRLRIDDSEVETLRQLRSERERRCSSVRGAIDRPNGAQYLVAIEPSGAGDSGLSIASGRGWSHVWFLVRLLAPVPWPLEVIEQASSVRPPKGVANQPQEHDKQRDDQIENVHFIASIMNSVAPTFRQAVDVGQREPSRVPVVLMPRRPTSGGFRSRQPRKRTVSIYRA